MAFSRCFPNAMVSNWQSAVTAVVTRPRTSGLMTVSQWRAMGTADSSGDAMIQAAASAGDSLHPMATGYKAVPLVGTVEHCAAAAFAIAKAKIRGDIAAEKAAEAEYEAFGSCDARWVECIYEFYAHYSLVSRASVPYRRWKSLDDFVFQSKDAGSPSAGLPAQCTIAIIGDWGTGDARANALLRKVAAFEPDVLIHLGDIYYSCTPSEANAFYENCLAAFERVPRIFTLCGNHDMYSGGGAYYALLDRLGQPASFFCLRNDDWQLLAMDTGYNDFDPQSVDDGATWVQDHDDRNDPYSELAWHRDKMRTAGGRKTVLLSHHQPFTLNSPIAKTKAVNERLIGQVRDWFPSIPLWIWGHEHNQVIYAPFLGVEKGRCIGASAIPVPQTEQIYAVAAAFGDAAGENEAVPALLNESPGLKLAIDRQLGLYNLGFAVLTLAGADGKIAYFQYDSSADAISQLHEETA